MTLDPVLTASPAIQIHIALASIALFLGPVALWRRRRDLVHRVVGYVWVLSLAGAAVGSLAIPSHFTPIGLGPIHLLSVYALWGLVVAMSAIWRGDVKTHRLTMQGIYVRGVALAGAFNFQPGRTMQQALIPGAEPVGYAIIAAVLVWAFLPLLRTGGDSGRVA